MKFLSDTETKKIYAGKTVKCPTCGKTFYDSKWLWIVTRSGEAKRDSHRVAAHRYTGKMVWY